MGHRVGGWVPGWLAGWVDGSQVAKTWDPIDRWVCWWLSRWVSGFFSGEGGSPLGRDQCVPCFGGVGEGRFADPVPSPGHHRGYHLVTANLVWVRGNVRLCTSPHRGHLFGREVG